ncbi:hypothetical protein [Sulfurimonas microaerophilic]|uniref:hypothetical protein n=1 Tax=Sulfurimonas microaerophilic TaxID=3058392 RepID=UPI002714CFD8|nr:hypothetical protein [Sulfurimonas sp. hsl 1-7]
MSKEEYIMIVQYIKRILLTSLPFLICVTNAEATPAFARQMDTNCVTCHSQNIPKLNRFGREFKMSGFTMIGGVKEVTGSSRGGLNIPATLNMGFIIKARFHHQKTASTTSSFTEVFDESAIVLGGKIAEHVGTSMEFGEGLLGGKIAFTDEFSVGRLGATIYMTDALGAFSGTEIYTTGLYRPIRQFENRKKANIFQLLGIGDGAATGGQVYYYGNGIYATIGGYVPVMGNSIKTNGHYKLLARAAYNMNIGAFDAAIGGYYIGGDVSDVNRTATGKEKADDVDALDRVSSGLDLQLDGTVSGISLMVTGGIVLKNTYTDKDLLKQDKTGFSIGAQLNPIERFGAKLAYLSLNDNNNAVNDERGITLGAEYNYAQNIRFMLEYSLTDYPDDSVKDLNKDLLFMAMIAF